MEIEVSPVHIRRAVTAVIERLDGETPRLCWKHWSENKLWAELVGCILSSQVPHGMCIAAHERLGQCGLLTTETQGFLAELQNKLEYSLALPFSGMDNSFQFSGRYRFPKSKARYIADSAYTLYAIAGGLTSVLAAQDSNPTKARRSLVDLCLGVGPKQASLFLRNVGFTDDLAVIDVHIMRYMKRMGITNYKAGNARSLSKYEEYEQSFRLHAATYGISVGVLDVAVWVVMRTIPVGA